MGATEATSKKPPHGRWRATCLLASPERDASASRASVDELRASLIRRGLTVKECATYHEVMAEAAMHERARRAGEPREPLVVVLIEPDPAGPAAALYDAALRHAPTTVFWELGSGASPRLSAFRPLVKDRAPAEQAAPAAVPHACRPARPPLRLAGDPAHVDEHSESEGASPASLLSEEELTMLLGEGPDFDHPGGKRA